MKIVMSLGYGRLHFIESAKHIAQRGINVRLVCDWVPSKVSSWFVRLCSRLAKRNFAHLFNKRQIEDSRIDICSCSFVYFLYWTLLLFLRVLKLSKWQSSCSAKIWHLFGWNSRRFLTKDVDVFHVRSGAGQGGAIAKAKRLGIHVVVDHSIAHPAFMEKHLRAEYEKNGACFDFGMSSSFWRSIVKDCEDADVVQVNSFFVRDTFLQEGFPSEKIKVIYLGVREDFQNLRWQNDYRRPAHDKMRLLFTGCFGFRKGAEYILQALQIVKEKNLNFAMDVYGEKSGADGLMKKYQGDELFVTLHGPVPQDDLKEALATADIYVFPSLAEGCAQSGMEALTAGLCVIATWESGLPITDGETGFIVPSKDGKAIAEKIMWLKDHPEEIERVGRNAAKMMRENYTWDKYAENCQKMYEELVR